MRVLLISPLPGIDPACGDIVYTQTLLAHPPAAVVYETYAQAIERGTLCEHGTGRALKRAIQERKGILAELSRTLFNKALNVLRRNRLLFWEPFRFFSVKPGEYDLIHCHVFSARFLNLSCPLIVSNAAPVRSLYRDARKYSAWRVRIWETVERILGWVAGVNIVSYHLPQAVRIIAFTEYLRNWYIGRSIFPAAGVDVIPIYLPSAKIFPNVNTDGYRPLRVGFVAKDFDAKGGQVLLRAFEQVRLVLPDAELIIVGSAPRMAEAEAAARHIRWIPFIPRERLMEDIFPSFDVFAYPTEFDGMPLVVLEALSIGIPVATSDYQGMPELVDNGRAGLVSAVGDSNALVANILALLEPEENVRCRSRTKQWFESAFSADAVTPQLLECYEKAIGSSGQLPGAGSLLATPVEPCQSAAGTFKGQDR